MTQFEYDQLGILAGAWEIEATKAAEPIAKLCRRHADELRELLRHVDTIPPPPTTTAPAPAPDFHEPGMP